MSRLSNLKDRYGYPMKHPKRHDMYKGLYDGKKLHTLRELLVKHNKADPIMRQREISCQKKMNLHELRLYAKSSLEFWMAGTCMRCGANTTTPYSVELM